jgi:TetR/AcrR family transcriptional repressor of nem operon
MTSMGRQKQFDPEAALERAMEVFWQKGYQNTSVSELLAAMGINRWSMYETFGGKQELFLASLRLYRRRWSQLIADHLSQPGSAKAALTRLLREMGRQVTSDKLGRGCLIANSAVELRYLDPEAAQLVRGSLDSLEDGFVRALRCAAADGEIEGGRDPRQLSRFLLASMNGIRDVAKMGGDRKRIDELVETLVSLI